MSPIPQFVLVEAFERTNDLPHLGNRANSQIPPAPMSSAALGYYLRPYKSFVRISRPSLGSVSTHASALWRFDEVLRAVTCVFFIRYQSDQGSPRKIFVPKGSGRCHHGGCAALHVIAPAAGEHSAKARHAPQVRPRQ